MTNKGLSTIHIYAKITRQHDVIDRINYICHRQGEKFICSVGNQDIEYWRQLAIECNRSTKNNKNGKVTQCKEIILYIPNEFLQMTIQEQTEVLSNLYLELKKWCGTDCLIAAHNSHPNDDLDGNAHLHILISERTRLHESEIKVAKRNLFFDEHNTRKRNKSDILDENGQIKTGCYIISKGEVVNMFASKYSDMNSPYWTKNMKQHFAEWINETFAPDKERVVYTSDSPYIPQQHIGKGYTSEIKQKIKNDNKIIKTWNRLIDEGIISIDEAMFYKDLIMLSPERGQECMNIYLSFLHEECPEEYDHPELIGNIKRSSKPLTAEELLKRELRKLYREAQVERNLANQAKSYVDRAKHSRNARRCSAEIDRIKKELCPFNDEQYKKEFIADEKELNNLQKQIENTKYWISIYSNQKGEISLAKLRTERKNLSDLYIAEKALTRQIAKNKEIIKNGDVNEFRKLDFSKRIESAEARHIAKTESFKDHSKSIKESSFGNVEYSDAQAIIDSYQIQKELGICNHFDLYDRIEFSEKNLVRLKETLARNDDMLAYYNRKKATVEKNEQFKIISLICKLENEQDLINSIIIEREKEYLKLKRALYGSNIYTNISQDKYKNEIDYIDLFKRHKIEIDYEHRE